MKHARLIKKLEEASEWRGTVPGLLLTTREREALLRLLRDDTRPHPVTHQEIGLDA